MPLPISFDREKLAEFCRARHINNLAFFGSVLRDDFTQESDVDVLVEFEPGERVGLFRLVETEDVLSQLLGRKADMHTAGGLNPYIKKDVLKGKMVSLDLEETLIALSISATVNPAAQTAVEKLKELSGCEIHMTHMPTPGDEAGLRKLGVNLTSDPDFATKHLFGR